MLKVPAVSLIQSSPIYINGDSPTTARAHKKLSGRGHATFRNPLIIKYYPYKSVET